MALTITSASNNRLKDLRRHARRRDGATFVVEGYRLLRRALDAGIEIETLFAAPELFVGPGERAIVARAARSGAEVVELGPAAFASIATQGRPDGVLGVARKPPTALRRLDPGPRPLVLVAERVERPGNLGTIVRAACAAGATGLIACDPQTDLFHPKTLNASVGAVFHLPLALAPASAAIPWLRERGISIVVATPDARTPVWSANLARPVACVVGCEKHGVTDAWAEAVDELVAIPMPGRAMDSLNVAVAAGIVLFEAARQRLLDGCTTRAADSGPRRRSPRPRL